MQIAGRHRITARRDQVIAAVRDPEILKRSIPSCESLDTLAPDSYRGVVALKLGPLRYRIKGYARLLPVEPPERFFLQVSRNPTGGRKITLRFREDARGRTIIVYRAVASDLRGPFASLGENWLRGKIRRESQAFFHRLAAAIGAEAEELAVDEERAETAERA